MVAPVIIGTALAVFSAVQQGRAANVRAQFQSDVAKQQADRELLVARQTEEDFRRDQSRLLASRKAGLGVSGVESTSGSPLLASEDFASEVELQALRLRSGGELRATRLQQTASLFRAQGQAARTGGFIRGAALLTGAGTNFA